MKLIKMFYSLLNSQYEAIELMEMLAERNKDGGNKYYDITNFTIDVYSLDQASIEYFKCDSRYRDTENIYYKGLKCLLPFPFIIDLKVLQLKHKLLKENNKIRKLEALKMLYSNKSVSYTMSAKAVKKLKNKGIFVTFKEPKDMV